MVKDQDQASCDNQSTSASNTAHNPTALWPQALGIQSSSCSLPSSVPSTVPSSVSQFVSSPFSAEALAKLRDYYPSHASAFLSGADMQQEGCYKPYDDCQGSMTDSVTDSGSSSNDCQGCSGTDDTNSTSQVFSNRTSPDSSNSKTSMSFSDYLEKTATATTTSSQVPKAPQSLPQFTGPFTGPLTDNLLLSIAKIVGNSDFAQYVGTGGKSQTEQAIAGTSCAASAPTQALPTGRPICTACKVATATLRMSPCGHQVR